MSDNNTPDSVKRFIRNYGMKHPGSFGCPHNVYHLIAEDRDGNIVNEAFGINVMTDTGFQRSYKETSGYEKYSDRMYLGDGVFQTIDPASTELVHAIDTTYATMINGVAEHMYTEWVPEKESNLVQFRLCSGWFDYTQWDVDKTVTEIGISSGAYSSINSLKYHAAIYNAEGEKSSFVKKVNEKLTINVYARCMVPIVKIVNESWDRGICCAIRSDAMFQQYTGDYWNTMRTTCYSYDWSVAGGDNSDIKKPDNGSITDHVYSTNAVLPINIFIDGKTQYISECIFSSYYPGNFYNMQFESYMIFSSKVRTPSPVAFQNDDIRTENFKSPSLRHVYAARHENNDDNYGILPMTNMHISSLKMFDIQANDWNINVPFTESTSYLEASYEHLRLMIRENNWITFMNDHMWHSVFINEAPQYPIKCIENCGRTMYCTDTYWDSSSWELIENTSNISRTQGAKRFFIMFETDFPNNETDRRVGYYADMRHARRIQRYDYDEIFPKLNVNNGYGEDDVDFGIRKLPNGSGYAYYSYIYDDASYCGKCVKNETIGYIAQDGFLIYPDSVNPNPSRQNYTAPTHSTNISGIPYIYNIGGVELPDDVTTGYNLDGTFPGEIWNTTRGTHIAMCGQRSSNKGFRVYTPNSDPTIAPTYENFLFDTAFSSYPCLTASDNGYVVASYVSGANNSNVTYVLEYDVDNVSPNMYKVEGYHHAHAIDLTSYFVAIDPSVSGHLHLVIYDMENRTVLKTIDIPDGYAYSGFAAWKNLIFIRTTNSGTVTTFLYYIQEEVLQVTSLDVPMMVFDENSYKFHCQLAVAANGNMESCMVLIATDNQRNNNHLLFRESDPTHPIEIINRYGEETSTWVQYQCAWLGYSSDNKQLILTYQTNSRALCVDIGLVVKSGAYYEHYVRGDLRFSDEQYIVMNPIYYGGFIYTMRLYAYTKLTSDNIYTSYSIFKRYPYQQWMPLQIIGTTYTPNALMNPVRINGNIGTVLFQTTNRDVDTAPEPYTPPL